MELTRGLKRVDAAGMSLATFVPAVASALKLVESTQPLLRPGSTIAAEKILQAKLMEQHVRIQKLVQSTEFTEYDCLPKLSSLLAIATQLWPGAEFLPDMATFVTKQSAAVAEAEQ